MHSLSFDFTSVFMDLLKGFASGIPKFLTALIIILVGYIVAKIVKRVLHKGLETVGIDKIGEKLNEIELVSKASIEIKFSKILAQIAYYIILIFFLMAATSALEMPAVSDLMQNIIEFIPNLIVAGIILVIGFLFSEMMRTIVHTALTSFGIPSARLISSFLFYFLLVNIVVSALAQAQIDTDFLGQNISILIGGIVLAFSIGYGLASKSTMANFIGSMYMRGKVNIGDKVHLDGVIGTVVNLDKSALTIEKESGARVYIPLSLLTTEKIEIL